MRVGHYCCALLVSALVTSCISFSARGDEDNKFYSSPEERREAGLGTSVTDWLMISGLLELEQQRVKSKFADRYSSTEKGNVVKTLQLGFDFNFTQQLAAELVVEAEDDDKSRLIIDEVLISWEWQKFGFSLGRYSPGFGEYFSHLITGPLLEFGETRANTVTFDYSFNEQMQVELFLLESEVDSANHSNMFDWGMLLEWESDDGSVRFGTSYLSDIGESDEEFYDEFNRSYQDRVAAISAYALWGFDSVEVTAEIVKTLDPIREFDDQFNQPQAFNIELAFYPTSDSQVALRYETSDRFEDNPQARYGIGLRWQLYSNINVATEYLYAEYSISAMQETQEQRIDDQHRLAIQVSIEF